MQPRDVLALAALAVLLPLSPAAAAAPGAAPAPPADPATVCGAPGDTGTPVEARLRGGPPRYRAGGDPGGFALDLRNTTRGPCHAVRPLLILAGRAAPLAPDRFTLEYRPPAGKWRTVPFEATGRGEDVGIAGGRGLTLPAGRTATVRLRLRFAPAAPPGRVVVSATAMRWRGVDGSWGGASNPYPVDVGPPSPVLADTGPAGPAHGAVLTVGAVAAALTVAGAALLAAGSRRRPPRRPPDLPPGTRRPGR